MTCSDTREDARRVQGVASDEVEEWRDVEQWEGLYQVSSLGGFRSFHSGYARVLAGSSGSDGYRVVILYKSGIKKGYNLHRLVCAAFHGHAKDGMEAAHIDGNRRNNRADNLKWATRSENLGHREGHGTILKGEGHPRSRLMAEQVRQIRLAKATAKELAARFGISRHTVSDIRRRKIWRSVEDESAARQGLPETDSPSSNDGEKG